MRKTLVLVLSLFVFTTSSYAAIGNYNFLLGVGGGYKTSEIYSQFDDHPSGTYIIDVPGYDLNAPIVRVDLGLPFHFTPHKSRLVHAVDIRANFTAAFAKGTALEVDSGKIEQKINSFGGGAQIVYGLGVALGNDKASGSKLVFDLFGLGFSISSDEAERTITYTDSSKPSRTLKDSRVSTKMEYIVPGIHYFSKSGFTIGIRNTFEVFGYDDFDDNNIDFPSSAFTSYAYIGYTFNMMESK